MEITKRDLVRGALWSGAAVVAGARCGKAQPKTESSAGAPRTTPGNRPIVPLPFDPKELRGLSEKLIRSHHENNYGGAVRNLNRVERDLAELSSDAPGYLLAGLRQRELMFRNSAALHELYFENLGGTGQPDGVVAKAVGSAYGRWGSFEIRFRATARSLSGGSGWAFLSYDLRDDEFRIQWAGDHTQASIETKLLLVLDMYEHSYHMDYGAASGKYVDAFMQNVDWEVVNHRYESALRITAQRRA